MPTLPESLGTFAESFEKRKRDDGSEFYCRADYAPDWLDSEAMQGIHNVLGDRLPDDWVYLTAYRCALRLGEYHLPDDTADDLAERIWEIADGLVDVYNSELTRWLASHPDNLALCDEAIDELGVPDDGIVSRIARGQYLAIDRICRAVLDLCEAQTEGGEE